MIRSHYAFECNTFSKDHRIFKERIPVQLFGKENMVALTTEKTYVARNTLDCVLDHNPLHKTIQRPTMKSNYPVTVK